MRGRRDELEYQARLLDSVPFWYIAPFIPGLLGFALDISIRQTAPASLTWLAIQVAFLGGLIWLNRVGAQRLREEVAALPSLDET